MADKRFIDLLPAGYDERTLMALRDDKRLMVTHPEHPPLLLGDGGHWFDLRGNPVHHAQSSST